MPKRSARDIAREWGLIILGAATYAVGFQFFFYPNDIIAGGVTGISTIINLLTGAPVGVVSIIINIPLFAFAWKKFGTRFMLMSLVGMALTYIFVDLFALIDFAATDDLFLAGTIGACLNGAGLGLVYRAGATGGIDIVAKILRRRYPYINFGTFVLVLDIAIIAVFAAIYREWEAAMYAVIAMFVVTRAIDVMLYGLDTSKVCYLISEEKSTELERAITETMHRGVTRLHGEGGYTGAEREVLMCVIKKRQITDLRKIVRAVDPAAFFVVTDANDVFGNGFGNIQDD